MEMLKRRMVEVLTVLFVFIIGFIVNATEVYAEQVEKNNKLMDYFPRSVGNSWTYTGQDEEGKMHKSSRAIIGKEEVSGEQYFVIENKIDGTIYETFWVDSGTSSIKVYKREEPNPPDKIEQYKFDPPVVAFVTLASAIGESQTANIRVECSTIKGSKTIKKEWITMTSSLTTIAKESVITPLGTFNDCVKFEHKIRTLNTGEKIQYVWLAPGVGQVKFTARDMEFLLENYKLRQE